VLSRERPASEGQDSLHPFQSLEFVKHALEIAQLDIEIRADACEGEVLWFASQPSRHSAGLEKVRLTMCV
jgi:hypothetical protein